MGNCHRKELFGWGIAVQYESAHMMDAEPDAGRKQKLSQN